MVDEARQRALLNFKAWWEHHGLREPRSMAVAPDRIYYERSPETLASLDQLVQSGVLALSPAGNHGVSVLYGYRERVSRCSAQLVVHEGFVEMDFDLWNPWDVRGLLAHFFCEVLPHKKTDPFKVYEALRKRGVCQA